MYQSGHAKELRIQRHLKDVEKLLRLEGAAVDCSGVLKLVEDMLRVGCHVEGWNIGGVKSITFTALIKKQMEAKQ